MRKNWIGRGETDIGEDKLAMWSSVFIRHSSSILKFVVDSLHLRTRGSHSGENKTRATLRWAPRESTVEADLFGER